MDLGLSQRKLARLLGVNKKTVENWERHELGPAHALMPRVVGFLGYEPERSAESLMGELAAYRRARGLTLTGLARELGVHPTVVARWETGQRLPKRPMARRVEKFMQVVHARRT